MILHCGDCLAVLPTLDENSLDSCVTDPPYHLTSIVKRFGKNGSAPAQFGTDGAYSRASAGFMGKQWDGGDIAFRPETWAEVYRVLKPGAHLLAFGGTRTYHRMACAIEDAGFEIRDCIQWLYGSGFPKSHDVSKGIDRAAGAEREIVGKRQFADGTFARDGAVMGARNGIYGAAEGAPVLTAPATDAARQWEGWGTALKPACEMIVLARKPLSEKTVAANVLRWGTGALNIDGCRVPTDATDAAAMERCNTPGSGRMTTGGGLQGTGTFSRSSPTGELKTTQGRWPANIIHDGSNEVLAGFPETGLSNGRNSVGRVDQAFTDDARKSRRDDIHEGFGDTGSAARFFYCAKASKKDRAGSKHPTVKPIKLIQYLIRMVTPPGGTVLDPFAGSGTMAEAAVREGMRCVLIEREPEYQADIRRRIDQQETTLLAGMA